LAWRWWLTIHTIRVDQVEIAILPVLQMSFDARVSLSIETHAFQNCGTITIGKTKMLTMTTLQQKGFSETAAFLQVKTKPPACSNHAAP